MSKLSLSHRMFFLSCTLPVCGHEDYRRALADWPVNILKWLFKTNHCSKQSIFIRESLLDRKERKCKIKEAYCTL